MFPNTTRSVAGSGRSTPFSRRLISGAALVGAAAILLSGCTGTSSTADDEDGLTKVTIALDYLPGLAHNGLAYAMQEGLFADQGIDLEILPFSGSTADTLVAAGTAEIGISAGFQSIVTSAAAGAPIEAFYNISPVAAVEMGVLGDSGIQSPADFAGRIYGGYGAAGEEQLLNRMITNDGGEGAVTQVVLMTGAQEALKSGDVDVTALYPADILQFGDEGIDIRTFNPADYGIPDPSGILVAGKKDWLSANPELAKGIAAALQEGYQAAIDDPQKATEDLYKQFPDLAAGPDYTEGYAAMNLYANPDGELGSFNMDKLTAFTDWALANGSITDANGKVLSSFDPTPFVTNEYLPGN